MKARSFTRSEGIRLRHRAGQGHQALLEMGLCDGAPARRLIETLVVLAIAVLAFLHVDAAALVHESFQENAVPFDRVDQFDFFPGELAIALDLLVLIVHYLSSGLITTRASALPPTPLSARHPSADGPAGSRRWADTDAAK